MTHHLLHMLTEGS